MELAIPNCATRGRIMFYGFRTTEDWLIDYAITHRATYGIRVTESRILNLHYALNILQRQTGINQLRVKTVLPENTPTCSPRKPTNRSFAGSWASHRRSLLQPRQFISQATESGAGGPFEEDSEWRRTEVVDQ